jgi:hypothetical protein
MDECLHRTLAGGEVAATVTRGRGTRFAANVVRLDTSLGSRRVRCGVPGAESGTVSPNAQTAFPSWRRMRQWVRLAVRKRLRCCQGPSDG